MHSVARLAWTKSGTQEGSLLLLGLALLAGATLIVSAARYLSDDLRCPVDGEESNYGEAQWSWFPIGTTCRWTAAQNGFDGVEGPGWMPTLLIASMVGVGLGLVSASTAAGRRDA